MRFQIVTLRVPFEPEDHNVPSTWNWDHVADHDGIVVVDCDPVSEDPDVQPIERLPEQQHSIDCQLGNPDDDCGACDEQNGGPGPDPLRQALLLLSETHTPASDGTTSGWWRDKIRELIQAPAPPHDYWGEHPTFPRSDWQHEAANGDTLQGYWEWCNNQAQNDDDSPSTLEAP